MWMLIRLSLYYVMQKETGAAGLCASLFTLEPAPLTALSHEADVMGGYEARPLRPISSQSGQIVK
jgi:hypothetical protein